MHEKTDNLAPYFPFHVTVPTVGSPPLGALPLGNNVTTTSSTTITPGNDVVITPASMAHILPGMKLNFSGGTGAFPEDVTVKTVNYAAGTFTADFKQSHSAAYNIISMRGQYLGNLVINKVATISGIAIYNGSPLLYNQGTGAGTLIASVGTPSTTVPYLYNCYCNRGVFYTLSATDSTGSVTFMVSDDNVG